METRYASYLSDILAMISESGLAARFACWQPQAFTFECVSLHIWTRLTTLPGSVSHVTTSSYAAWSCRQYQAGRYVLTVQLERRACQTLSCFSTTENILQFSSVVDEDVFRRPEAVRDFAIHCSLEVNRPKFKGGRTVCVRGLTSWVIVLVDNSWCGSTSPRRTPLSSS